VEIIVSVWAKREETINTLSNLHSSRVHNVHGIIEGVYQSLSALVLQTISYAIYKNES
jgi:hypothetical protein